MAKDEIFYDEKGKQIKEFDVVRVFHYFGVRNKKHYMYKWIRYDAQGQLVAVHLNTPMEPSVPLCICGAVDGVLHGFEILY